jgi:hypothetical protein
MMPSYRPARHQWSTTRRSDEVALAFANDGPRLIECAIDPDDSFDLISWGRDNPL